MSQQQPDELEQIVTMCLGLRGTVGLPAPQSGPSEVLDSMHRVRGVLDQVEELLARVTRFRARAQRASKEAEADLEARWDEVVRRVTTGGVRDLAFRERQAHYSLETVDLQVVAKRAADLVSRVDEAYELVRLTHRGLDALRYDHHVMLRALVFEDSISR